METTPELGVMSRTRLLRHPLLLIRKAHKALVAWFGLRRNVASRIVLGEGEMSALEVRKLLDLVKATDPSRPIIEIGTLFGSTAIAMCYVKAADQKLISVDNFSWNPYGWSAKKHERLTRRKLAQVSKYLNVEILTVDRKSFYSTYQGPAPSLVFLDADHSYEATLEDIRWAQHVGADVICGDDYGAHFPGVIDAVNDCGGAYEVIDELFVLNPRK